jgi:hypothetical protein
MENPCFDSSTKTDCPDRHGGCHIECERWAEYVEKRNKHYEQRHKEVNGAVDASKAREDRHTRYLKAKMRDRQRKYGHY